MTKYKIDLCKHHYGEEINDTDTEARVVSVWDRPYIRLSLAETVIERIEEVTLERKDFTVTTRNEAVAVVTEAHFEAEGVVSSEVFTGKNGENIFVIYVKDKTYSKEELDFIWQNTRTRFFMPYWKSLVGDALWQRVTKSVSIAPEKLFVYDHKTASNIGRYFDGRQPKSFDFRERINQIGSQANSYMMTIIPTTDGDEVVVITLSLPLPHTETFTVEPIVFDFGDAVYPVAQMTKTVKVIGNSETKH